MNRRRPQGPKAKAPKVGGDPATTDLHLFAQHAPKQRKTKEVSARIRALIVNGDLKPGTQLPSEVELAEAFGISRNTLRDALNILHQEGTLFRRHGVGTFVTQQLLMPNRLDVNLSTTELIRSTGREPGDAHMTARETIADEALADILDTDVGDPIIEVERLRSASDKPLVYSLDYFSVHYLTSCRPPMAPPDVVAYLLEKKSIYQLFEERFGMSVDYGVATIKPALADARLAENLKVSEGTLLMVLDQTDYNARGQPLMASHEYHVADVYSFTVYRKS